jgi:hypothetical protein
MPLPLPAVEITAILKFGVTLDVGYCRSASESRLNVASSGVGVSNFSGPIRMKMNSR